MESEPSLLARLYEFGWALGTNWWGWVTGLLLVTEQAIELFFPTGWKKLEAKFPKEKRRRLLLWGSLATFVLASFQAFDDVNKQLRQAQTKSSDRPLQIVQGAKLVFSRAEAELQPANDSMSGIYLVKLWFQNSGNVAAEDAKVNVFPIITDSILSNEDETKYSLYKSPNKVKNENDVQPGDRVVYYASAGYVEEYWKRFSQGNSYLYLVGTVDYKDQLSNGKSRITTQMCMFFQKNDLNNWRYCAVGGNRILRDKNF